MRARTDRVLRRRAAVTSLVATMVFTALAVGVGPSLVRSLGVALAHPAHDSSADAPVSSAGPEGSSAGDRRIVEYPARPNGDVVVYLHGATQDAGALVRDSEVRSVADALLEAGYVVASSDAGLDSWGDEDGVREYLDLVADLRGSDRSSRVFLVAESMGALSAAQVAARVDVSAWVAMYPVCDVTTISAPSLVESLAVVYPDGPPATLSPVRWPKDVPVKVWASPDDTLVPKASNADRCASAVDAPVVSTTGDHGDPSNFDGQAVADFFRAGHGT